MKIGYARVSTDDQNLASQLVALRKADCDTVFSDQGYSGATFARPGLSEALRALQPGDTLVVWRLDRLGRSLLHLVELIDQLGCRGVDFLSLTESINTASSGGTLVFHMMAALAQFERSLISERTRAGMAAARARGRPIGRRASLSEAQCREAWLALRTQSLAEVAGRYCVHPRTLQRLLRQSGCLDEGCGGGSAGLPGRPAGLPQEPGRLPARRGEGLEEPDGLPVQALASD